MQTIRKINISESITVLGLELRTTNERAFEEIPAHWERFHRAGALEAIQNRVSDDVYAVYTNFEHPGVDNQGMYSLIIGARVEKEESRIHSDLAPVTIVDARRAVFSVAQGHPEQVGDKWREIWSNGDLEKTYLCDYERYQANGEIDIFVGIR